MAAARGGALRFVPRELRTPEICLAAVRSDGWALLEIPDSMKTPEMCWAAVASEPAVLESVPDGMKTLEMCSEADLQQEDGTGIPERFCAALGRRFKEFRKKRFELSG